MKTELINGFNIIGRGKIILIKRPKKKIIVGQRIFIDNILYLIRGIEMSSTHGHIGLLVKALRKEAWWQKIAAIVLRYFLIPTIELLTYISNKILERRKKNERI